MSRTLLWVCLLAVGAAWGQEEVQRAAFHIGELPRFEMELAAGRAGEAAYLRIGFLVGGDGVEDEWGRRGFILDVRGNLKRAGRKLSVRMAGCEGSISN